MAGKAKRMEELVVYGIGNSPTIHMPSPTVEWPKSMDDILRDIEELNIRLEKVENRLFFDVIHKIRKSVRRRRVGAFRMVDTTLIRSIPRTKGFNAEAHIYWRVLTKHKFAACQCLLMIIALISIITVGLTQLLHIDEPLSSEYKPHKVKGKDEYYRNKDLRYTPPEHGCIFELGVLNSSKFDEEYTQLFNEECESSRNDCLTDYMYEILDSNWESPVCTMRAIDHDTFTWRNVTGLKSFTDVVEQFVVETFWVYFAMLLEMEIANLNEYMCGLLTCTFLLEMEAWKAFFSTFSHFQISSPVSRSSYYYSRGYYDDYVELVKSVKTVWPFQRQTGDTLEYIYEETTFDDRSKFTADVIPEPARQDKLTTQSSPYPTVLHYVSYDNYGYLHWIADIGGFYTWAAVLFLFLVDRVSKFPNRGTAFLRAYGLLPAFSLPHRNGVELVALKLIVLATLGVTGNEYFTDEFQFKLANFTFVD